ncbi:MAG: macro domain-containing protein [Bacteroidota bacterium]
MQLILTAIKPALAQAWEAFCGDLPFVEVHHGSILDVETDAIVSPANSFGFMDGGIDAVYLDHFGRDLQTRLRRHIAAHHHGELLVGTAAIVETGAEGVPFMVAAPTMRVPMILRESVNPYLAARATLLLVQHGRFATGTFEGAPIREHVNTVAFPGLGTGVGQIGPNTCARQMRAAIDEVVLGQHTMPASWAEASERHQLLYTDRPRRLQY